MRLSHPGFRRPSCRVVLVRGAPGSGKTRYCMESAGQDDVVIDLDDCFSEVCGEHGHIASSRHLEAALSLRNEKINGLSRKKTGTAFIVVCCPSQREVDWWVRSLGCDVVTVASTICEIESRDISASRKRLAATWFQRNLANDWCEPLAPRQVGPDGY